MAATHATPVLLGIGNPLLDITVNVPRGFLAQYGLKAGDAILAEDKHMPIYGEAVKADDVQYIPGGSSMNATRAAQWMLQEPGATAFVGCVGRDPAAATLKKAVAEAGVRQLFLETDKADTGKCAVLVTEKERTLVTYLGAANCYDPVHMRTTQAVQDVVAGAKLYYAEGYFITVTIEPLLDLGKRAIAEGKSFLFNLSAPFLMQFFWERMEQVLPYVTHVFCNETEAATIAPRLGVAADDLPAIARALAAFKTAAPSIHRTVVITNGPRAAVACRDGAVTTHEPEDIPRSEIVDTNGAGDSFVGGFLAAMIKGNGSDIAKCMAAGNYCAGQCLRHASCKFSGLPKFTF
eukprot:m51a1_g3758 adenosine kinase, putative (349) ;mRNA; r:106943-108200